MPLMKSLTGLVYWEAGATVGGGGGGGGVGEEEEKKEKGKY